MTTNEQRRDIAHAIRRLAENNPRGVVDFLLYRKLMLEYSEYYVAGVFTKESVLHLAEIIEPEPEKTCKNVGYQMTCSECGAHVYGAVYEHSFVNKNGKRIYTTANEPKWNYCPNCGAKVVE